MIQVLTAGPLNEIGLLSRLTKHAVTLGARQLLRWEPVGSVLIDLPDGQRIRFGKASTDGEPILSLNNYRVLFKAFRRGSIGFAQSYIDGDIDCNDLVALFRFFVRNRDRFLNTAGNLFDVRLHDRIAHFLRRNSHSGSRRNISEHYDLGNDFYRLWLDKYMNYSSGLYATGAQTLEEAQSAKLALILELLELRGGENILEIGCGWGAFAREAVSKYQATVRGLTLSHEQLAFARNEMQKAGLGDRCEFLLQDYRDAKGQYDRVASIEMIEAVGEDNWRRYFETLRDRLSPGGIAVVQSITIAEEFFKSYRQSPDFIQRFIFPGGMLPTPSIIHRYAMNAGLRLDAVHCFGIDYASTLSEWNRRFEAAWPEIAKLGFDERFRRKWRYYLAYCEAGFLEKMIDVGVYRLRKDPSPNAS